MTNLTRPIAKLVADVRAGKLSAESLVQEALEAIKTNEDYHAVLELNDAALDQAREVDAKIATGDTDGALLGIPYIAKDNFLTVGTHTTAASHILEPFESPYESTVTSKIHQAGAIMVAKANLDAFAHGSSTENSDFGPSKNPVDSTRVPGGSSGGSATAVALGLCSFATGTDTGGSIRQPASFCGVVGLKPTYGLVSRYGVVAMGSSTDCIGPLARSVDDAALILDVIAGKDPMDSTTIDREDSYVVTTPAQKLKVGVVKEYFDDSLDAGIRSQIEAAIEQLKQAGAEIKEVSLPSLPLALAAYYVLVPAEVSSNLSRYDGVKFGYRSSNAKTLTESYTKTRAEGFGAEAKRRILIGTYMLSSGYYDAYYKQAQKVRTKIIDEFTNVFETFDVLVGPTTPTVAFKLGEKDHDPLSMYLNDVMTTAANLAGVPAISVPAGEVEGLPVGIQLIAAQKNEATLLAAAKLVEAAA